MTLSSAAAARRAAASVLAEPRFHQSGVPNPLQGVVRAVGEALSDPVTAVERLVDHLGSSFAGGVAGIWAIAALILVVAVAALALRRARTRSSTALNAAAIVRPMGPEELERAAASAERVGRWNDAVRLRYRAGILRVGQRLELASTATTPNRAIGRMLRSERFEAVSSSFEEVAYGVGTATAEDAERQRRDWPEILAEAGRV